MNFRVGQKVVCVDDAPGEGSGEKHLRCGAVYEIVGFDIIGKPIAGLFLKGVPLTTRYPNGSYQGWKHTRFRPAVDRKTDISTFTKILDDVSAGRVREIAGVE